MRTAATVVVLALSSLLLAVGCGLLEQSEEEAPPENTQPTNAETTTASSEATRESTRESTRPEEIEEPATIEIVNSFGEVIPVRVEIADSQAEQARGLMERTELAEDAGMLFVFEDERQRSFFMRNTYIPLSIAYINAEGVIVDIQDMQPLDETSRPSAAPAKYALEVNQGFFARHGIEVGNMVRLPQGLDSTSPGSSAHIVQAFREAGLEVGESYPVEEEPGWEQKPVPKTYEEATRFEIPSLGEDTDGSTRGGRVFVFESEEDLAAVRDYYEELDSSIGPYVYTQENVLVQIANQLPQAEAERYGAVVREAA